MAAQRELGAREAATGARPDLTAVMTRYRGRVPAWDVVNEALNDDGTRRDCLWKRVIGDDWGDRPSASLAGPTPGEAL